MRMWIFNSAVMLLLMAGPAIAASPLTLSPANQLQAMKITSDSSTVDRVKGIATFMGQVVFIQGTTKVTGDKMVVYFDAKGQFEKVKVTGNLAQAWLTPTPGKSAIASKAQTIIYNPSKNEVQLIGQAEAEQNSNVMKGPMLIYNTKTQVLMSAQQGNTQGRTVIILQPQNGALLPSLLSGSSSSTSSSKSMPQ